MPFNPHAPVPPLFSRRDLFRLASMVTLLTLIGLTIYQTRQEKRDDTAPLATKSEAAFVETLVSGPNDLQALQATEATEQFQAVSDKTPLTAEEMPSYWRLMRWSMTQTFDELWERAHQDRYLTHLGQTPEKHRGELIALKLSLRRSASFEAPKNSAGVKTVYEAWGVTDESRGNFYCLVFYDKPPELAIKPNIHEEATFVGYFLKQFTYEDAMGVKRWAPLLIGRLHWRENLARTALRRQHNDGYLWQWLIVAVAVVVFGVAWKWTRPSGSQSLDATALPDHAAIERWLEDGAPEAPPGSGGIFTEWEGSEDADAESRPASLPKEPTNSLSGDASAGG